MNFTKQSYDQLDIQHLQEQVNQDPWRLQYHLMPPVGWLNDPNGLCQFQGTYHVYYQYSPDDVEGKTKLWGHYSSQDLLTWKDTPPVLFEDSPWDNRGVYSGSALIHNDQIHYFFTGNVKLDGNHDFILTGRQQNTLHVSSCDGFMMSDKTLLLTNDDYPRNMSCHVRDPKVFQVKDQFYMVLGARSKADEGCVLVYQSFDLKTWSYTFTIQSQTHFGTMWECPDLIELDGQYFLLVCPQGLPTNEIQYQNIYQSGYFPIQIDFQTGKYQLGEFQELDYGFDFYAPQTFLDESKRRILIGWMGLPDIPYSNLTTNNGWQHALTMPRQLVTHQQKIYQQPIEEMKQLRCDKVHYIASSGLKKECDACFECHLELKDLQSFVITLRHDVTLSYDKFTSIFTCQCNSSGAGRTKRYVEIINLCQVTLFSDTSSLEIFLNAGEKTMTTRLYDVGPYYLNFNQIQQTDVTYYKLKGYTIEQE